MNPNRIAKVQIALLAIACCLMAYVSVASAQKEITVYGNWACDLIYRHNEISCMHDGIDPFDIFERKTISEKYRGCPRPDKTEEPADNRRIVHTYPAWHAAVFWWYGYTSRWMCITIMICLNLFSLVGIWIWLSQKNVQPEIKERVTNILFLLTMFLYPLSGICWTWNYGLLLLGCLLLLWIMLDSHHDMLAGIIYSFIMIKPQIGVLLIFPLLFNKKYKTIFLAAAICLAETCFTAWMLRKSPFELILQIPKIGAPFYKGFLAEMAMKILGSIGQYMVMGLFICLTACGSFLVRNAKKAWIHFLPASAFIPFWTYSQYYDCLVTLPCIIYILKEKNKYPRITSFCFLSSFLYSFINFANYQGWYCIGKKGIATILYFLILSLACLMTVIDHDENGVIHCLPSWLASFRKRKTT